jgi:hypothetical protein
LPFAQIQTLSCLNDLEPMLGYRRDNLDPLELTHINEEPIAVGYIGDACSLQQRRAMTLTEPRFPILTLEEGSLTPSLGYLFDRK